MGREIRRIPPGWQHPQDAQGNYAPLHDRSYAEATADYEYARRLWAEGRHPGQIEWPDETQRHTYEEWVGPPPDPAYYRAESWTEDDAVLYVLYENVTEGTPLSPAFESLDGLLAWMRQEGYSQDEVREIARVGRLPTIRAYARAYAPAAEPRPEGGERADGGL